MNRTVLLAIMSLLVFAWTGWSEAKQVSDDRPQNLPAIGDTIADFQFTDIRHLPRTVSELGQAKATVVVFVTLDCPIAKRSLPKLREMEKAYRDKGVQFLAINVGPGDSLGQVAWQAIEADIPFPFVKDFSGEATSAVGATRTPECVVLDAKRVLRYRGRIDPDLRLGGSRSVPGRADLKEAIDDILAGREVRVAETPVDGCLIESRREPAVDNSEFHRDVAPLVKKHCQSCHQPGSAGPFSLISAEDVLSHADMIDEVVSQRRMPPWNGHSESRQFANDPRLTEMEINTIVGWIAGKRAVAEQAEIPETLTSAKPDWKIGEPDLVVRMVAAEQIPETGYIPYRHAILPYVFLEDTWIQKIEINPGNDAVVHHCNMGFLNIRDLAGEGFHAEESFVTGYVPGGDPMVLDSGVGFCIPAGSMLGLQLHYVTTGKPETDRTSVGLVFAKEKIQKQVRHFQCHTSRFAIPPGAPHHKVQATKEFQYDATGYGMYSHMHLRGKDMTFQASYPDGTSETLLSIPNFNFDWQASYRLPRGEVRFPKGTRIDCTAHFDNSTFNPYNPDPTATVRHGIQTYEEMMYGFLFFTRDDESLDLEIDPKTGYTVKK